MSSLKELTREKIVKIVKKYNITDIENKTRECLIKLITDQMENANV